MGKINFDGTPPFDLPFMQGVGAIAVDDCVQLTFYVSIGGQRKAAPVRAQMSPQVVRALIAHLASVVETAEMNGRNKT